MASLCLAKDSGLGGQIQAMRSTKLSHVFCLQLSAWLALIGEIQSWQKIQAGRRNKGHLIEHITKACPLATAS